MNSANFKIVLAGDEAVGKTCLIRRLIKDTFSQDYKPTLGFEILLHQMQIKSVPINFVIWDIAGQTAFESVRQSYYKDSRGFLLVFNLGNRVTLRNLEYWVAEIKESCPTAPFVMLGNKVDLPEHKVTEGEMKQMAQKLGAIDSIFTSAKTGQGVIEAFTLLGTAILRQFEEKTIQ
ncbi:MAG: small GTP-binding protein [Promethearchaeota archaeon CR_4]|nr:MAG: small GTP-binding protein [Candidatus Lokiarchaeota archaeon CR_4]